MELYHGSYMAIPSPEIIKGRFTKDFGEGFYCTSLKHQAEKWEKRYDTPVVNIYEYPTHQINFCTSKALAHITYKGYEKIKP